VRVSGKVTVDNRFRQYQNLLDRQIVRSLGEAAGVGMAAARSKPSRYNIGSIKNTMRVNGVIPIPGGYMIVISWPDFRAFWMDRGTYQKLGRVLSVRSKRGEKGNRGIKPQRFTNAAKRAARIALVNALRRNLG
jgi:hypothetical protein